MSFKKQFNYKGESRVDRLIVLEKATTRQLLSWRNSIYKFESRTTYNPFFYYHEVQCEDCFRLKDKCSYFHDGYYDYTLEDLKTELAKRPHILNKEESRPLRKAKIKQGN